MNDLVIMERQNIVDIADAIRNKTGVNDEMTLVDMVTSINEIEAGGEELPSAENSAFGVAKVSEEYGIISPEALGEQSAAVSGVTGIEFKARESIAIVGLRVKPARASNTSLKLCLWNENAELLQQTSVITTTRNWLYAYFDTPVNINADEIFIASVQSQSNFPYRKKSGVTFNGKLSFQAGRTGASGAGYAGFPDSRNTSNIYGIVDVIIVPVQAELPVTYQVKRTTMDDIAEEVQRITGTETKISTAQIITALESQKATSQFPSIPADVYAQYPYAWCSETASGNKWCWVSSAPWFVNDLSCASTGNIQWYKAVDGAWTLNNTTSNTSYYLPTYPIAWSNRNIPNGSVSATDIYFTASPILV